MAVPYRPGKGFDKEALARLRARRHDSAGFADLPAEDKSKQWDSLLGVQAKKVPRCGLCTRPADGDLLLCSACRALTVDEAPAFNTTVTRCREHKPANKESTNGTSRSRSATPSTATSDDGDHRRGAGPRLRNSDWRQDNASGYRAAKDHEQEAGSWYGYRAPSDYKQEAGAWYGYQAANGQGHEQTARLDDMAAQVIREIQEQLQAPGNRGFVWIADWNVKYQKQLGTLRSFLEQHPDKFTIIPLKGKGFRIEMKTGVLVG